MSGRSLRNSTDADGRSRRPVDPAVAVAVLCVAAAVGGLFLYQPGPAEPAEAPFGNEDAAPADGSYSYVAELTAEQGDERTHIEESRTYAPGDPAVATSRMVFVDADGRTTYAAYERGETAYSRQQWTNASEFETARDRRIDENVVRVDEGDQALYDVDVEDGPPRAGEGPGLLLGVLSQFRYERGETSTYQGREVVRYEAVDGWVDRSPVNQGGGSAEHLVTSAEGAVLVDARTGAVLAADVEGTIVQASTWGGVLTADSTDVAVSYRVETDVDRPEAPSWVATLEDAENAGVD